MPKFTQITEGLLAEKADAKQQKKYASDLAGIIAYVDHGGEIFDKEKSVGSAQKQKELLKHLEKAQTLLMQWERTRN